MQLLIEFGAPAMAFWLASNVLLVLAWCWSCSRRTRRSNNMRLAGTMLPMGDILPFRRSSPDCYQALRSTTIKHLYQEGGRGAISFRSGH